MILTDPNILKNVATVPCKILLGFLGFLTRDIVKHENLAERCAKAYTVPVAVLIFMVIQGQLFLCHLKATMRLPLPIND